MLVAVAAAAVGWAWFATVGWSRANRRYLRAVIALDQAKDDRKRDGKTGTP